MNPDQLLDRIATTLRTEVGPAVEGEFAKTQAFMAAVVLEKLARQLASAAEHEHNDRADRDALVVELTVLVDAAGTPQPIRRAVADAAATSGADAELCRLIELLYQHRSELGDARFAALLGRVRRTLRAQIDRRMEAAG